jgi:hypothetical protein
MGIFDIKGSKLIEINEESFLLEADIPITNREQLTTDFWP